MKKYIFNAIILLALLMPNFNIYASCSVSNFRDCDREGLVRIIKEIIISRTGNKMVDRPVYRSLDLLEASVFAKHVESLTKVDASIILAIISRESSNGERFGGGIGNCYLKNITTGEGIDSKGNYVSRVMSPGRDVSDFLEISETLGKDYDGLLVSCPMESSWGGAIGVGQFIPSSWTLVSDDVSRLLGKTADPWEIMDGFLAIAILLEKNGVLENPKLGICRYHSGRCNANGEKYAEDIISKGGNIRSRINLMIQNGKLQ